MRIVDSDFGRKRDPLHRRNYVLQLSYCQKLIQVLQVENLTLQNKLGEMKHIFRRLNVQKIAVKCRQPTSVEAKASVEMEINMKVIQQTINLKRPQ